MKRAVLFLITASLAACAPKISSKLVSSTNQQLSSGYEVYVIETAAELPSGSELIGEIKIGDTGFSMDCGYSKVMTEAKETARRSGANIVQLIQVKKPSTFGSSCYRVKAKLYRNLNAEALSVLSGDDLLNNRSRLPPESDFAMIYFYRPASGVGALLGYKIRNASDSIIGRVRNGEKFAYKTSTYGLQKFFGELETKEAVDVNVERGKEYFVRCGVTMGVVIGRPEIYLMPNRVGIREFNAME